MRVAIIEGDDEFRYYLKEALSKENNKEWQILFFNDTPDFGKVEIKIFNTIIVSHTLRTMEGVELLQSIHDKTDADLYLICDSVDCISKTNLSHDYIKGVIKKDPQMIINKLKYLETKCRLNRMIAVEDENMNRVVVSANGYSFEINNNIAFIEIKRILSEESKNGLVKKIDESNVDNAIVSYPDRDYIETMHCSQIFDIYKAIFNHGGKMVFCNTNNKSVDALHECKIDLIMPIFDDREKAIEFFLHT